MNPVWRNRLSATVCAILAIWLGWQTAEGAYGWLALAAMIGVVAMVVRFFGISVNVIVVSGLLFGYLVGNRGFAQLMPLPTIPLLPAELGLMLAGGWLFVQSAFSHRLPIRRTTLDAVVLAWLVAGTARAVFDVRQFGLLAVRDYAMIYYAAFFYLGRAAADGPRSQRFLVGVLVAASITGPIAAVASSAFPDFFFGTLTVRGVPLIYFKGDLAATFIAVSAILLASVVRGANRYWGWPLATVELLYVLGGENRASMVGAFVGLVCLSVSRLRRFVLLQVVAAATALLLVFGLATVAQNDWAAQKLAGLSDRAVSLVDVVGSRAYVSDESSMKGDNNRFRAVWWRSVWHDTMTTNPVFGLGFGYDLARGFLQEYNPEMAEEFTARSPHSIAVSAVGRMGLVGLAIFIAIVGLLAVRTWNVVFDAATEPVILALWACIWVILVSACFGVVLEGPMGAVVFWTFLGVVTAAAAPATSAVAEPEPAAPEWEPGYSSTR